MRKKESGAFTECLILCNGLGMKKRDSNEEYQKYDHDSKNENSSEAHLLSSTDTSQTLIEREKKHVE